MIMMGKTIRVKRSQSWISIDNRAGETLSAFEKVENMDIGLRQELLVPVRVVIDTTTTQSQTQERSSGSG